jgi:antitoxin component YwqK of YwqJK toxin-antitoxin module
MKAMNVIKNSAVILGLTLLPLISFSQEVPCREWYYTTDSNGNQIKGRCKQAWQVNSNGQKHGKFIQYQENGNPDYVKTYSNGVATGSFVEYNADGVTVLMQGNYLNGNKVGKWRKNDDTGGFLLVDFDKDITFSYHWKNLVMKYDLEVGGITGDVLIYFEFNKHSYNSMSIVVNGSRVVVEGFPSLIGLDDNWEWANSYVDGINVPDPDPLSISGNELNAIIRKLKKNGVPQNSFVALRFSKGKLDTNGSYRIFDSTGRLVSN